MYMAGFLCNLVHVVGCHLQAVCAVYDHHLQLRGRCLLPNKPDLQPPLCGLQHVLGQVTGAKACGTAGTLCARVGEGA
jgi:hypothetical protein